MSALPDEDPADLARQAYGDVFGAPGGPTVVWSELDEATRQRWIESARKALAMRVDYGGPHHWHDTFKGEVDSRYALQRRCTFCLHRTKADVLPYFSAGIIPCENCRQLTKPMTPVAYLLKLATELKRRDEINRLSEMRFDHD